jgi:hypothetical protein
MFLESEDKSMMDISEIRKKWDNGGYTYKSVIPKKVSEDHVFDEDLSVKKNRELAKEHNDNVARLQEYSSRIQGELYKQLTYDIVKYIMDNYDLTEAQARKVESFVYQEHHSYMGDYFYYIDTFAEFAAGLVESEDSNG